MAIRTYQGIAPTLGREVYVDEFALVLGDVTLGDDASIWPFAVLRGSARQGVLIDGNTPVAPTTTEIPPPGQQPGGDTGATTDTGQGTVAVPVPGGGAP